MGSPAEEAWGRIRHSVTRVQGIGEMEARGAAGTNPMLHLAIGVRYVYTLNKSTTEFHDTTVEIYNSDMSAK